MKKERIQAKVKDLVLNEGQLAWLPRNPRQWTKEDIDRTKASLERDPDFQEDNPIKVVRMPEGGKLLVFAGNLRTTASRRLKWGTFEAILYTPETEEDYETIKRRAMLDNGSFGSWDFDTLANEWGDCPLQDWGVPAWDEEEEEKEKATEALSQMAYDTPYYEPKENPAIRLEDCADLEKYKAKVAALQDYDLTDEQRKVMEIFAYRFIKIDFEKVATYYAFNATEEEKKAIERLRLVLVDSGSIRGFIEDDMIRVASLTDKQLSDIE